MNEQIRILQRKTGTILSFNFTLRNGKILTVMGMSRNVYEKSEKTDEAPLSDAMEYIANLLASPEEYELLNDNATSY